MIEDFEKLSELFRIFGDPTRLKILAALEHGERNVGAIADELNMNQSAISHQLNTLKTSRLIKCTKVGKAAFYALDDEHVHEILTCGIKHITEGKV